MREHKYRAWYKSAQKMYLVSGIDFDVKNHKINTIELLDPVEHTYHITEDVQQVELMQVVRLKDKNAKDGYGDDLVKMFDRSLFQIVWDDYYARFQLNLAQGNEHRKVWDMGMLQFAEIVGNIYEHPQLLEG